MTQDFFARLLEKNYLSRANPQRGRFRSFLLTSLQNFLTHEWERARAEKRGGGRTFIPWDEQSPEERYRLEAASDLTPDKVYEQHWAMALFQRALGRLHNEFADANKREQFDQLKGFLSEKVGDGAYAQVASRLGMTTGAVAVAVHRLRERYGQLVREEIVHTVASPEDVEVEMRYLIALMSG